MLFLKIEIDIKTSCHQQKKRVIYVLNAGAIVVKGNLLLALELRDKRQNVWKI